MFMWSSGAYVLLVEQCSSKWSTDTRAQLNSERHSGSPVSCSTFISRQGASVISFRNQCPWPCTCQEPSEKASIHSFRNPQSMRCAGLADIPLNFLSQLSMVPEAVAPPVHAQI